MSRVRYEFSRGATFLYVTKVYDFVSTARRPNGVSPFDHRIRLVIGICGRLRSLFTRNALVRKTFGGKSPPGRLGNLEKTNFFFESPRSRHEYTDHRDSNFSYGTLLRGQCTHL